MTNTTPHPSQVEKAQPVQDEWPSERVRNAAAILDTLTSNLAEQHPLRVEAAEAAKRAVADLYALADRMDALQANPSGPDEPIAHVANDYNASGLSCHITEYLPAGMPLYARPSAMPALTDAMRAVLRNERDVYESEDALYAALVAAADLKAQGSAATPLGSMTSPHTSPGGPGQPVPMPASEAVQEKAAPSDEEIDAILAEIGYCMKTDGFTKEMSSRELFTKFAALMLARHCVQPAQQGSEGMLQRAYREAGLPGAQPAAPDWTGINAIIGKHFKDDPANACRAHAAIAEVLRAQTAASEAKK